MVVDTFLSPIMGMLDNLGIKKTAAQTVPNTKPAASLPNKDLAAALGKMAGDMPEDVAGQDMHDEKTDLGSVEQFPAKPEIENTQDGAYRLQKKQEDDLGKLEQSSAPLSDPSALDTNQDPLSLMAAKMAAAIEPRILQVDRSMAKQASLLVDRMYKTSAPFLQAARQWIGSHPEASTAIGLGGGLGIGGGLGFFTGQKVERDKDKTEDQAILQLGAEIGGRMAANQIMEQLQNAGQEPDKEEEGED